MELENHSLREQLADRNKSIRELQKTVTETFRIAKEAESRSNYNEQYSRKNNIKIHGLKERPNENTTKEVQSLLKSITNVELTNNDIIAAHRIPGKAGTPRPVLLKVRNNDIKSTIMKRRSVVKRSGNGLRLSDDVTKLNSLLINKLLFL